MFKFVFHFNSNLWSDEWSWPCICGLNKKNHTIFSSMAANHGSMAKTYFFGSFFNSNWNSECNSIATSDVTLLILLNGKYLKIRKIFEFFFVNFIRNLLSELTLRCSIVRLKSQENEMCAFHYLSRTIFRHILHERSCKIQLNRSIYEFGENSPQKK